MCYRDDPEDVEDVDNLLHSSTSLQLTNLLIFATCVIVILLGLLSMLFIKRRKELAEKDTCLKRIQELEQENKNKEKVQEYEDPISVHTG